MQEHWDLIHAVLAPDVAYQAPIISTNNRWDSGMMLISDVKGNGSRAARLMEALVNGTVTGRQTGSQWPSHSRAISDSARELHHDGTAMAYSRSPGTSSPVGAIILAQSQSESEHQ